MLTPPGVGMVAPPPISRRTQSQDPSITGGLALDALHLLPRDVDRASEIVGLEHPAFHHILNRRRSEAQILGRFRYGDFHAVFVFHPVNLPARQRLGPGHPQRIPWPVLWCLPGLARV